MPLLRNRGGSGGTQYQIREKMFAIGEDFWVETNDGDRAFKVNGKVLRIRDTLVLESPTGRSCTRSRRKRSASGTRWGRAGRQDDCNDQEGARQPPSRGSNPRPPAVAACGVVAGRRRRTTETNPARAIGPGSSTTIPAVFVGGRDLVGGLSARPWAGRRSRAPAGARCRGRRGRRRGRASGRRRGRSGSAARRRSG